MLHQFLPTVLRRSQPLLSLPQNYFQKLEKLAAAEEVHGDGPKKERTKLITPQVAKLEHTYKPGKHSLLHTAQTTAGEGWWWFILGQDRSLEVATGLLLGQR